MIGCQNARPPAPRASIGSDRNVIRETQARDTDAILAIVEDCGQFDADSIAHVRSTLEQHLAGDSGALWLTADDGEPVGVAYCAPEVVASGTWNLLMLWTRQDRHGRGHGAALVRRVEEQLRQRSARLLIVETSGLAAFAPARAFYAKCGFLHEAQIANFFSAGDDKLILTKSLAANAT
jgi:ribosomal protein S18 acetylase RimI-like enzyme